MAGQGAGSTNEFWRLTQNSDGSYKIVNAYSGLDLEDYGFQTGNGAKVDQWADNGRTNEHRNLIPSRWPAEVTSAWYRRLFVLHGGSREKRCRLCVFSVLTRKALNFSQAECEWVTGCGSFY
jgi:hypothetical protein